MYRTGGMGKRRSKEKGEGEKGRRREMYYQG